LFLFSCGSNFSKTKLPISNTSEEAKKLFNDAYLLTQIFKEDEAKAKLIKAIEIDPNFGMAYILLSSLSINTGSETDEYYEKAFNLSDKLNEVEKCFLEIRKASRENDSDKRLEYSRKLVELIPENAIAHQRLSWSYWQTAKIENMRASAENAIKMDKNYIMAYSDLANSYMFNEPIDYQIAEKYAKNALSLNKNESFFHVLVGDVLRAQNKLEEAAKKYDDAYKTGTNNFLSAAKAGHAYSFISDFEARERFNQAIKDARNPNQKFNTEKYIIYTHLYGGDFQKGHTQLLKLMNKINAFGFSDEEKNEWMSDLYWNEYFILSHSGKHAEAKKALSNKGDVDLEIAKKSKNKLALKNTKSNLLWLESHSEIMKGNYDIAKTQLSKLKEMVSGENNPTKYDGYNNLMGMVHLMSGNARLAVDHFQKVEDQSNIYFTYFNGLALKANGNMAKAKEIFKSVATYNFNGLIYTAVRNKAIKEVEKG